MDARSRSLGARRGSAAGTNAGVTVTLSGAAGKEIVVENISGSGDAAALVTIESPAATIIWRKRFAAAFSFSEPFAPETMKGATGQDVLLKISASTANCEANIDGYDAKA